MLVGGVGWVTVTLAGVGRLAYADPLRLTPLVVDQVVLVGRGALGPVVLWPVPGA